MTTYLWRTSTPADDRTLFGLFARPAPSARLALCSQLAEVFRPARCGERTTALVAHDGGGAHALLADEIVHQGECGAEVFAGTGRAVLGKVGSGFEDQVGIGYQVAKGFERVAVVWHTFSVKRLLARCKRSLFFVQRTFQALPRACQPL
jgi:hypothetical protein